MKKVKGLLALVLLTSALFRMSATNADIIVLMDASGTIFPWFEQINNTILVDITKKFVRPGDTFHLISFNSRVNLEIVQPIKTESDISRIVSRFMLLYPLGQNSDFLSGIQYTWQYAASLDQKLDKIVVILSDGIFNPPKSSPYVSFNNEQVKNELVSIARKIRGAGWDVYYIKLPFPENSNIISLDGNLLSIPHNETEFKTQNTENNIQSEYLDISGSFSSAVDIQLNTVNQKDGTIEFDPNSLSVPEVIFPSSLGKKGKVFSFPFKIQNNSNKPLNLELTGVFLNTVNILNSNCFINISSTSSKQYKAKVTLPEYIPFDNQTLQFTLQFAGNERVNPQSALINITVVPFSFETFIIKSGSIILNSFLVIFSLLIVILLLIIITRRTSRSAIKVLNTQSEEDDEKSTLKVVEKAKTITPIQDTNISAIEVPNIDKSQKSAMPISDTSGKFDSLSEYAERTKQKELSSLDAIAAIQEAEKEKRNLILTAANLKSTLPAKKTQSSQIIKPIKFKKGASAKDKIETLSDKRILLELHVNRQNPHIGKRNIHVMKPGSRLSIGGGHSSFLVFLVHFPPKIAEVRYDGISCSLAILKPEFFPYETNTIIENCIEKEIILESAMGYEVSFYLREYEDPVLVLNRILKSIIY